MLTIWNIWHVYVPIMCTRNGNFIKKKYIFILNLEINTNCSMYKSNYWPMTNAKIFKYLYNYLILLNFYVYFI